MPALFLGERFEKELGELGRRGDFSLLPVLRVRPDHAAYYRRDIMATIPKVFPGADPIKPGALAWERRHRPKRLIPRPESLFKFF